MNDATPHSAQDETDSAPAPVATSPASRLEHRIAIGVLVGLLLLFSGGGLWIARLWRDPQWAHAARQTWRIRGTFVANPDDPSFRARYAAELLRLAIVSPPPVDEYFDWRADRHCAYVRDHTPPGTFASCRQMHLDRLRLRQDGAGLMAAALHELEGAPEHWIPHLHRYVGQGAVMVEDWDSAREHFSMAYTHGDNARDALRTAWVCLQGGQPAVALDWLDRAFETNRGYPPPYRGAVAATPMRESERRRYLDSMDAEAGFYDACRAAAHAALDADPVPIPSWPTDHIQL